MVNSITPCSTLLGEGEARATFRSSSTFRSIFHRFDNENDENDENDENYENDENDENHQPVVYSQIDPNRCKSVSID